MNDRKVPLAAYRCRPCQDTQAQKLGFHKRKGSNSSINPQTTRLQVSINAVCTPGSSPQERLKS